MTMIPGLIPGFTGPVTAARTLAPAVSRNVPGLIPGFTGPATTAVPGLNLASDASRGIAPIARA